MRKKFEHANSIEERQSMLQKNLESKKKESEKRSKELSEQLCVTMEEFNKLGIGCNYDKLLEKQLVAVEQQMKGAVGEEMRDLRATKEVIERKYKLVQEVLALQ